LLRTTRRCQSVIARRGRITRSCASDVDRWLVTYCPHPADEVV